MSVSLLADTAVIAGLFGIAHVIFTIRVGNYRRSNQISLGDGGDKRLQKLARGQGNFTENVPIALIIIALLEANGAGSQTVYAMGLSMLAARIVHYFTITTRALPFVFRPISMVVTLLVILTGSLLLLIS